MPTPEKPEDQSDQTPSPENTERLRTIAVRVHEDVHSQLGFIAELSGTSISSEIRAAIAARIAGAHNDPELIARAQQAREEVERQAAARSAAIAGFIGAPTVAATTGAAKGRRSSQPTKKV